MSELPILFTPVQAAKIMGISRSKVYELMNSGQLGSVHIGRSRRVSRKHLDEFISSLILSPSS
jgi:excisionase family DNA binding protein